jgi:hypothetical protein
MKGPRDHGKDPGVAMKLFPDEGSTEPKEEIHMNKVLPRKLNSTKRWLGKKSQATLNIRPAQAALVSAEKAATELSNLKTRLAEVSAAKKSAIKSLESSLEMVRVEKKLKAKQAKIQAKLAALGAPS